MVYMAKCPSACSSANSNSLDWFKISERGLISGTLAYVLLYLKANYQGLMLVQLTYSKGSWGNGEVMKTLSYTTTIPSALAAGNYLIRVGLVFALELHGCILNWCHVCLA